MREFMILVCFVVRVTCFFTNTIKASRRSFLRMFGSKYNVVKCLCVWVRGSRDKCVLTCSC